MVWCILYFWQLNKTEWSPKKCESRSHWKESSSADMEIEPWIKNRTLSHQVSFTVALSPGSDLGKGGSNRWMHSISLDMESLKTEQNIRFNPPHLIRPSIYNLIGNPAEYKDTPKQQQHCQYWCVEKHLPFEWLWWHNSNDVIVLSSWTFGVAGLRAPNGDIHWLQIHQLKATDSPRLGDKECTSHAWQ